MESRQRLRSSELRRCSEPGGVRTSSSGCLTFWEVSASALRPGEFNIAILRGVEHFFRASWELASGAVGGWLIIRRTFSREMMALFCGWLALVGAETLTSGGG